LIRMAVLYKDRNAADICGRGSMPISFLYFCDIIYVKESGGRNV